MRIAVGVLLVALLLPSVGAVASRPASACCCKPDAGAASCPLKAATHGCSKNGGRSCGVRRAEPFAATLPPLARSLPTLMPEALSYRIDIAEVPLDRAPQGVASSARRTPEPPPPRRLPDAAHLHRRFA
jgi:hypothetical protein